MHRFDSSDNSDVPESTTAVVEEEMRDREEAIRSKREWLTFREKIGNVYFMVVRSLLDNILFI